MSDQRLGSSWQFILRLRSSSFTAGFAGFVYAAEARNGEGRMISRGMSLIVFTHEIKSSLDDCMYADGGDSFCLGVTDG